MRAMRMQRYIGALGIQVIFCALAMAEVPSAPFEEEFPESRFGAPPQRGEYLGYGPAVQAVDRLDQEIPPTSGGLSKSLGRGLASVGDAATAKSVKLPTALQSGVQEIALIAGDLGYFPKALFVTRGTPVKIFVTGASKKALCFMLDPFEVRKQIRSQRIEEIQFTPNAAGQFRFHCPVNGIEGTLYVKDLGAAGE
jgi:hypothetical protein